MTDRADCQRFQMLLAERLDRALDPEELEELEAHLSSCESCREVAAALAMSDTLARQSPPPTPLAGERLQQLVDSVMADVEKEKNDAFPAPLRGMPNWRELLSSWGFPSVAGVVALAVLAFFLLRSPQAPVPTTTGGSVDKDLLTPAESAPRTAADAEAPTQMRNEKHALSEGERSAPSSPELPEEQVRSLEKAAGEAQPSAKESLRRQAPASLDEKSAAKSAAKGAFRASQLPDSLAALHALGIELPLTTAQRDSLRAAWNTRLRESTNSTEQERLRAALEALENLPPPQN
jgi:hypothetical protein